MLTSALTLSLVTPETAAGDAPAHAVALPVEAAAAAHAAPPHGTNALVELSELLHAVQHAYEPGSAAVAPALLPLVQALTAQLNAGTGRYAVRFFAPDERLAARRADHLRTLFARSGLRPDCLTLTGHPGGTPSVEVVPVDPAR